MFIERYPDWQQKSIEEKQYKTSESTSKWGRLQIEWLEKATKKKRGHTKTYTKAHRYDAVVNARTGDLYLDCSKKKILAKFSLILLGRPFHAVALTLYHLSGAGIIHAIVKAILSRNSDQLIKAKQCALNCAKSLADIVLTPAYGIALTVISLAALIIGPMWKGGVYRMREVAGKVEKSLFWGEAHHTFTLAHCFQPQANLETLGEEYGSTSFRDTEYPCLTSSDQEKAFEKGFVNFARAVLRHRRRTYNPFDQLFGTLSSKEHYVSPVYRAHMAANLKKVKRWLKAFKAGKIDQRDLDALIDKAQEVLGYYRERHFDMSKPFGRKKRIDGQLRHPDPKIARKEEDVLRKLEAADALVRELKAIRPSSSDSKHVRFNETVSVQRASDVVISYEERLEKRRGVHRRANGASIQSQLRSLGESYRDQTTPRSYRQSKKYGRQLKAVLKREIVVPEDRIKKRKNKKKLRKYLLRTTKLFMDLAVERALMDGIKMSKRPASKVKKHIYQSLVTHFKEQGWSDRKIRKKRRVIKASVRELYRESKSSEYKDYHYQNALKKHFSALMEDAVFRGTSLQKNAYLIQQALERFLSEAKFSKLRKRDRRILKRNGRYIERVSQRGIAALSMPPLEPILHTA